MNESETSATPPAGYVPCEQKCGRYTNARSAYACWTCASRSADNNGRATYPDWSPPLPPSPAVNVERRAGYAMLQPDPAAGKMIKQLQKHIDDVYRLMATPRLFIPAGSFDLGFADAPAESVKPCDRPTSPLHPPKPCPPAQEAPKVPTCRLVGVGPHGCDGAVAMRIMRGLPVGMYCETAYRTREASITQLTRNATGTPYTGPTRLPRPVLAHAAGMHDDDLRAK